MISEGVLSVIGCILVYAQISAQDQDVKLGCAVCSWTFLAVSFDGWAGPQSLAAITAGVFALGLAYAVSIRRGLA